MNQKNLIKKYRLVRQYQIKVSVKCNRIISLPFILLLKIRFLLSKIIIGGGGVNFVGLPVINLWPMSTLKIGQNVTIVSKKYLNPLGLNKRSIITTLRRNAEIVIMDNVAMSGITLCCREKIVIGRNVIIGANTTIVDTDFHNFYGKTDEEIEGDSFIPREPVIIEDNVKIAMNVTILKGVSIGENSIIAANSVVVKNVPPNVLVGGNPAKVIRNL